MAELGNLKIPIDLHTSLKSDASNKRMGLNDHATDLLRKAMAGDLQTVPEIPDGLKPSDAAAVRSFIDLLLRGDEDDRNLALMVVKSWNKRKDEFPKTRRAVAEKPSHVKARRA
jgi:hypothetical protein